MSQKSSLAYFLTLHNVKYVCQLKFIDATSTRVICEAAAIDQPFLNEDIPALLMDLPNLILAEKEYLERQTEVIRFRVSSEDKKEIEKKAARKGYKNVSSYLRDLALG